MVLVRPAEPADAEDVARVYVRTWQSAYAGIVPASVLTALDEQLAEQADRIRQRWSSPERRAFRTLVATAGGGPVGFATFGPYRLEGGSDGAVDPSLGEVLAIYVHPDHQSRGAGRALLDAVVAALGNAGASEIRLWVLAENWPSRRFYERYGFLADGASHLYRVEPPDGPPVDLPEVRYALALR